MQMVLRVCHVLELNYKNLFLIKADCVFDANQQFPFNNTLITNLFKLRTCFNNPFFFIEIDTFCVDFRGFLTIRLESSGGSTLLK